MTLDAPAHRNWRPVPLAIGGTLAGLLLAATAAFLVRRYDLAHLGQMDAKTLATVAVILHAGLTAALVAFVIIARPFNHRVIGNTIASALSFFTATAVMFFSVYFLREPQIALDWAVMVFSGIISGIFVFFIVWGHFQDTSVVKVAGVEVKLVEDTCCPKCGVQTQRYRPVWTILCAVVLFPAGLVALLHWRLWCPTCNQTYPRTLKPQSPQNAAKV